MSRDGSRHDSSVQHLPIVKLVVLHVITGGLYQLYWFYRNWSQLKRHYNLPIRPVWLTLGLLVPVFNLNLIYEHFKLLKKYLHREQITDRVYPFWYTAAIASPVLLPMLFFRTPFDSWLYIPAVAVLMFVQLPLNRFWVKVTAEQDVAEQPLLNRAEWIVVGTGLLYLVGRQFIYPYVQLPEMSLPHFDLQKITVYSGIISVFILGFMLVVFFVWELWRIYRD